MRGLFSKNSLVKRLSYTHLYIGLVWKDLFEFIYCHLQFERAYGNNLCHVHELFLAYFQKRYTLAYENYL